MTTDPFLMELTFELPATPEEVWHAIATAEGISSWFIPTDLEPRVGGRIEFHMGETSSVGEITAFEPGRRIAYEEPDWPELGGHENTGQGPMVSEWLIEAASGGTCVLRIVTSAYGAGADWEQEFWDDMVRSYRPALDTLERYVTTFPGQTATVVELSADVPGAIVDSWASIAGQVTAGDVGSAGSVGEAAGTVLRRTPHADPPFDLLLQLATPVAGLVSVNGYEYDGQAIVVLRAHLFGADAPAQAEALTPGWQAWLDGLGALVA